MQLERHRQREDPMSQASELEAKGTMHSCVGRVKGMSGIAIQPAFNFSRWPWLNPST